MRLVLLQVESTLVANTSLNRIEITLLLTTPPPLWWWFAIDVAPPTQLLVDDDDDDDFGDEELNTLQ